MLRGDAVRVLRSFAGGRDPGAVVAARADGLHDAVHDQHAGAAVRHHRRAEARQRRPQGPRGRRPQEGRGRPHPRLPPHAHSGPRRAVAQPWPCSVRPR